VPQITIEYSGNLGAHFRARPFARRVHDHVVATIDTDLIACKTRLVEHGETVLEELELAVDKPEGLDVQLTVEIRDLDRDNYHKKRL
jgi:5-carboxymethyl-2-hydroxymuconate isomerase